MTPNNHTAPRITNSSPIARARLAKGWTQAQLADAIGVCQQMIGRWETGRRNPKKESLMRIGKALGVDWTTLINEVKEK